MIENGTLLQDRYLIEKQIGAGGMGAVYLAVDQRFESFVAIKETFYKDDELGEAFEREAKLLNGLHHPNLPHVSDHFTENGGHFLVMQFIEGEDLYEILKHDGAFPLEEVLRWSFSLLDALDYLHSQEPPVIHRDIKPQNLKITTRGDVILLDFGLAKLNSDDTQNGLSVFGYSRKYSPLEQIQGTGTDARSDIFALGATVYHLLTGKPPIDALARAAAIVAGNLDPIKLASEINSEIPEGIASVLNSALALNSAARFVSAKAMRQALENAVNSALPIESAELPAEIPVIAPSDNATVISVDNKHFPALDSFVAETASDAVSNSPNDKPAEAMEIPVSAAPEFVPISLKNVPVEEPTRVSARRAYPSSFNSAAILVLLICVGLAAGYFIKKTDSSEQPNQQTAAEETAIPAKTNVEETADAEELSTPEISDAPPIKTVEQTKIAAPVKSQPIVEKQETVAKREVEVAPAPVETATEASEKTKPVAEKAQKQPSAPKKVARRSQPQPNDEERSRVVEETQVPDIESIFTGRPSSAERGGKVRGNGRSGQQPESMSDEEWKQIRRQRREERRRRQNQIPFPF